MLQIKAQQEEDQNADNERFDEMKLLARKLLTINHFEENVELLASLLITNSHAAALLKEYVLANVPVEIEGNTQNLQAQLNGVHKFKQLKAMVEDAVPPTM